VDGCAKYDAPSAGWTVHGAVGDVLTGNGACWLVGDGGALIVAAPGTSGISVGNGPFPFTAYETYDECVSANCALPATEFTFGGGVLGVRQGTGIPLAYISGETIGGRGPTFRLSRLDPCS
jgi:hypothetical protein